MLFLSILSIQTIFINHVHFTRIFLQLQIYNKKICSKLYHIHFGYKSIVRFSKLRAFGFPARVKTRVVLEYTFFTISKCFLVIDSQWSCDGLAVAPNDLQRIYQDVGF